MSKLSTNLLGRAACINQAQGPFPEGSLMGTRAGQIGEIVTVLREGGQLCLGVLWPDGQITSWPAECYTVGLSPELNSKDPRQDDD